MTNNTNLREMLEKAFANVNEWLKFAEQKNAALVAFNSAVLFGFLNLPAPVKENPFLHAYIIAACIFIFMGAMVSLISFIPKLRIPWKISNKQTNSKDNFLFFGHIANYTPEKYLADFAKSLNCPEALLSETVIEKMYAEQIVVNARIANNKYACFTVAVGLTLSGFLTPLPAIIRYVQYRITRRNYR